MLNDSVKFSRLDSDPCRIDDWWKGSDRRWKIRTSSCWTGVNLVGFARRSAHRWPPSAQCLRGISASAFAATTGTDSNVAGRLVKFRDGTVVPALGQGSGYLGQGRHPAAEELRALINSGHRRGATAGRCLVRGRIV